MSEHAVPRRTMLIVITCAALVVTISMGLRQAFGIFLQPISQDLGMGREVFSLAIAFQNLIFGLPLVGIIADRFGSRWVIVAGGLLYAVGMLRVPFATTPGGLYLTLGLLVGLALSATTYVVVLGAVAQVVPPEKRSTAFGITTAAGSFGMFAMVPVTQALLASLGWEISFMILAALVGVITFLALGFPGSRQRKNPATPGDQVALESLTRTLLQARRHTGYWLLNAGFFVCGFHVAFIATHLPAFLTDNAIAPGVAAGALALIGLSNIFGSYGFGFLGDRYPKKYLLGFLYLARAVVISLFLIVPLTAFTTLVFGATIGLLWLATVPLTSGMVAQIFGSRYLSTLYGIVFLSHQIGSFLGVWLGGRMYDVTGSYDGVWMAAVALGVVAAVLHLPISDTPLERGPPPQVEYDTAT